MSFTSLALHSLIDETRLEQLFELFDRPTPRYTSYPTALELEVDIRYADWRRNLSEEAFSSPLSLYLHLPFCHSLCYFCACTKVIPRDASIVDPYLSSLTKEISQASRELSIDTPIRSMHWGGGTPNYLTPKQIEQLYKSCVAHFPQLQSASELSFEIDPRTISYEQLALLKQLGFSRVSLGVQDFSEDVQAAIHRFQSAEQTIAVYEQARALEFPSINVDLIYGLPAQSEQLFAETLKQVIALRPNRIALYAYAHVTWIKKVQRALERHTRASPRERLAYLAYAVQQLTDAGYQFIGLDHFALPDDELSAAARSGCLRRNFMGYTTDYECTVQGFGMSAISETERFLVQNVKTLPEYMERVERTGAAIERGLERSIDDQIRNDIISQILCSGSLDYRGIEDQWQIDFNSYFSNTLRDLERLSELNIIELKDGKFLLTLMGRLFSRNIAALFDGYLEHEVTAKKRRFSQAV